MASLIEIIVVLVLLGILAAFSVPRYLQQIDLSRQARTKVAVGQIGAVKGRLTSVMNQYMLEHSGAQPADGDELIAQANTMAANTCPTTDTTEGDFVVKCTPGTGKEVVITISAVQGYTLTPAVTGSYRY